MIVPLVQFATANGLILLAVLFDAISVVLGENKWAVVGHFSFDTVVPLDRDWNRSYRNNVVPSDESIAVL